MRLEDTYNIHKKINCILPFFKSKKLCKKGIHNYVINHKHYVIPHTELKDDGYRVIAKTIRCEHRDLINLKCICCGKEEKLDWRNKYERKNTKYNNNNKCNYNHYNGLVWKIYEC